jgi:hypothetical protein
MLPKTIAVVNLELWITSPVHQVVSTCDSPAVIDMEDP